MIPPDACICDRVGHRHRHRRRSAARARITADRGRKSARDGETDRCRRRHVRYHAMRHRRAFGARRARGPGQAARPAKRSKPDFLIQCVLLRWWVKPTSRNDVSYWRTSRRRDAMVPRCVGVRMRTRSSPENITDVGGGGVTCRSTKTLILDADAFRCRGFDSQMVV